MAHKTLTISEEAYNALSHLKNQNESFTDVILRLSKQREAGRLSDYIKTIAPDRELADNIEKASRRLRKAKLRNVDF
jgi:predicted CopG family antitoxin